MWKILLLLVISSSFGLVRAHTVETVALSFLETGDSWQVEILLDASLAVPDLRDDPESLQPEREWLSSRSDSEHQLMRVEAERYLREAISFSHDGAAVSYDMVFTDYMASPPVFPKLLNGGAYMTVHLFGELGGEHGDFSIHAATDNSFDIVIIMDAPAEDSGAGSQVDPESVDKSYFTVLSGETTALFTTSSQGVENIPEEGGYSLLNLGFRHVIPDGLDHMFFILCLFLLARRWRPLMMQSLVFTLAHSLTLGLVVSGALQLTNWPTFIELSIEPLIAVSILVLAVENIVRKKFSKSRYIGVFIFGLIHGLGFAGSLGSALQLSVQDQGWVYPLAMANLGVELAQVCVILGAWILTIPLIKHKSYPVFERGCSVVIALIAGWMVIERVLL